MAVWERRERESVEGADFVALPANSGEVTLRGKLDKSSCADGAERPFTPEAHTDDVLETPLSITI